MAQRLLVTGYGGFVAGSVVSQGRRQWQIVGLSHRGVADGPTDVEAICLDLCDKHELAKVFRRVAPVAVIHTAALADIDACQVHPEVADAVNVDATRQLAELCQQGGAKMVFCSTDTLFDGSKGNYCEDDLPRALNYYAETKIRAERAVRAAADSNVVARLSLVMGLPILGAGNSFLAKMICQWNAGHVMRFAENEIRTPIDVITLGRALLELAAGAVSGTIHLAGNTRLNRYEMALQIADRIGYSRDLAEPTDSSGLVGRAPRPADVSLDNRKARRILQTPMRTLAEGLNLVLEQREKKSDGKSRNQA
jgi:dTDP-4-dehydrorhamnose reductase